MGRPCPNGQFCGHKPCVETNPECNSRVVVVLNETGERLYGCHTIREAEAFIAGMEQFQPDRVHRGDYGIDACEAADAEYQAQRARHGGL